MGDDDGETDGDGEGAADGEGDGAIAETAGETDGTAGESERTMGVGWDPSAAGHPIHPTSNTAAKTTNSEKRTGRKSGNIIKMHNARAGKKDCATKNIQRKMVITAHG